MNTGTECHDCLCRLLLVWNVQSVDSIYICSRGLYRVLKSDKSNKGWENIWRVSPLSTMPPPVRGRGGPATCSSCDSSDYNINTTRCIHACSHNWKSHIVVRMLCVDNMHLPTFVLIADLLDAYLHVDMCTCHLWTQRNVDIFEIWRSFIMFMGQ